MEENLMCQLSQLQAQYAGQLPPDQRAVEQYAWVICKALNRHTDELGALSCRQWLSELMRMPLPRPSALYSSVLWAAVKVAKTFTDFHFVPFLNLWDPSLNLRPEDYQQGRSDDGKVFPSLAERMTRCCLTAQLVRPSELPQFSLPQTFGFRPVQPMIVTRVNQAESNGRKLFFVHLIGLDGTEVQAEAHALRANPLTASPDRRHYVNPCQLYNVLLRDHPTGNELRLQDAVLSDRPISDVFPVETGFVGHVDVEHGHIHVFDHQSRHFVSSGQRFVQAGVKQFVRFIPIVPNNSTFKTALIVPHNMSQAELAESFGPRQIRITQVNTERNYCRWELIDPSQPVSEQLSSLQLSNGEVSPSFTSGFINLDAAREMCPTLEAGQEVRAIMFLRRGSDHQKRPHVAMML